MALILLFELSPKTADFSVWIDPGWISIFSFTTYMSLQVVSKDIERAITVRICSCLELGRTARFKRR